jgi:hypothetical protein
MRRTTPPSRPYAATRSGCARALTPTPTSTRPARTRKLADTKPNNTEVGLDRPLSFRNDLHKRGQMCRFESCTCHPGQTLYRVAPSDRPSPSLSRIVATGAKLSDTQAFDTSRSRLPAPAIDLIGRRRPATTRPMEASVRTVVETGSLPRDAWAPLIERVVSAAA